jgi:hypothetical protein
MNPVSRPTVQRLFWQRVVVANRPEPRFSCAFGEESGKGGKDFQAAWFDGQKPGFSMNPGGVDFGGKSTPPRRVEWMGEEWGRDAERPNGGFHAGAWN